MFVDEFQTLIRQTTPTTCGRCCVAMLTGETVEQVIANVGHADIMGDDDIARAFGLGSVDIFYRFWKEGPAPDDCVALQFHKEPGGDRGHWTVSDMGVLLDPAEIGDRLWPVEKHAVWSVPE